MGASGSFSIVLRRVILTAEPHKSLKLSGGARHGVVDDNVVELVRRLVGRGTEDAHEQERRLATARTELDAAGEFDHVVINDTVASATAELERLMGLGS